MNLGHQVRAAGSRRPANVAVFIALTELAEAFEFAAESPVPLQPLFELHLPAANQVKHGAAGLFEIRVDAHGLRKLCRRPTLGDSKYALIAQVNEAKIRVPPFAR